MRLGPDPSLLIFDDGRQVDCLADAPGPRALGGQGHYGFGLCQTMKPISVLPAVLLRPAPE